MFSLSKTIIAAGVLAALSTPFHGALAGDMGNEYFPIAGREDMSPEQVEEEHDKIMQKMQEEYQNKLTKMNENYEQKMKIKAQQHEERMQERQRMAELKEERDNMRRGMIDKIQQRREDMARQQFEEKNAYVVMQKEREERFE